MAAVKKQKQGPVAPEEKPPLQVLADPMSGIVVRNVYNRDNFRKLLSIAVFQSIAIVVLVVIVTAFINLHEQKTRYFVTTSDGRLVDLPPLDEPGEVGDAAGLASWISKTAPEIMTFNPGDYKRRLQEASIYFTRKGWEGFTGKLQQAKFIEAAESGQTIISKAAGPAVFLQEGLTVEGRYFWHIQLPLTITYQKSGQSKGVSAVIDLVIVRVPSLASPKGLGIDQWAIVAGQAS